MKLLSTPLNFFENVRGGGSPDKGLRFCIVCDNMRLDSFNQFIDATKNTPPQTVDREIAEESFNYVKPGSTGRSEVKVESGITPLPGFDFRMLMSGVIIADDVDLLVGRCRFDNQVEEADPFLVPVLLIPFAAHTRPTLDGLTPTFLAMDARAARRRLRVTLNQHSGLRPAGKRQDTLPGRIGPGVDPAAQHAGVVSFHIQIGRSASGRQT